MQNLTVKIKRLPHYPKEWDLPKYGSEHAACFDLMALLPGTIKYKPILPGWASTFKTGLSFAIPEGFAMLVKGRSGLAFKSCAISFEGTVDSDYRGEVKLLIFNHSDEPLVVSHGSRIAQAMIIPVPRVTWEEVEELSETERGEGGFGSTGR